MKYEVDLPPETDRSLRDRASESGIEVGHMIHMAVVQFIDEKKPSYAGTRRLPDPAQSSGEISSPIDLPRSSALQTSPLVISHKFRRLPDVVSDAP